MSLQQNRRVSFSDMNRSLTVTNGNTGIGTTAPAHMLDVNGGMRSINFTTTSALITNVTTGTLNASTGITASSAQLTNINATTISAATAVATTYTGGSISLTGAVTAVTGTIGTFVATTSSAATVVATTYTGGSMSLSGNLAIGGTLTTVNITTTNISETNVSAGTVSATNIGVTTQTVGTSRITTSLLALGNSNTVGNIFTTGGNVGIATTSPGSALHVAGAMPISPIGVGVHMGIDLNTYAQIQLNSTIGSYIDFGTSGGDYYSRITGSNNGDIYISTNGGSNNRYVGIGTVTPGYTLDVNGSTRIQGSPLMLGNGIGGVALQLNDVSGAAWQLATGDYKLSIGNGSIGNYTTRMTISSTGNIGIGTVSPRSNLEITQTSSTTGVMLYSGLNDGGVNSIFFHHSDRSQGDYRKVAIQTQALGSYAKANLGLCVNTANDNTNVTMSDAKLFISGSTGNIGIGTTAPSGMLHLNNAALFTSAGNLTCTGDIISFGSLSDRRLKKNIETIETLKALDVVSKLRAVTFDWREDIFNESKRNTSDIGFIAQEVEELVPQAVSEYKEINSGEVYKSIKYERLIPYLVGSIQTTRDELQTTRDELQTTRDELQTTKDELKILQTFIRSKFLDEI